MRQWLHVIEARTGRIVFTIPSNEGEEPPDPQAGWGAIRSIDRDSDRGLQQHLKLLSPEPKVDKVLEMAGFKRYLEVFSDLEEAIASF